MLETECYRVFVKNISKYWITQVVSDMEDFTNSSHTIITFFENIYSTEILTLAFLKLFTALCSLLKLKFLNHKIHNLFNKVFSLQRSSLNWLLYKSLMTPTMPIVRLVFNPSITYITHWWKQWIFKIIKIYLAKT